MHTLKIIGRNVAKWIEQALFLPRSIASALKEKRAWMAQHDLEAERLDRIRNPSKYLGK
jgi:hypothetical protein